MEDNSGPLVIVLLVLIIIIIVISTNNDSYKSGYKAAYLQAIADMHAGLKPDITVLPDGSIYVKIEDMEGKIEPFNRNEPAKTGH